MKHISKFAIIIIALILHSCATYLIPIDSFKQQFSAVDSSKLVQAATSGPPFGNKYAYRANQIKTIYCVDSKGQACALPNKPSMEIRFTYGNQNKRTICYFDTVILQDGVITGSRSRFLSDITTSIFIEEVTKIEVQDGKKNFH